MLDEVLIRAAGVFDLDVVGAVDLARHVVEQGAHVGRAGGGADEAAHRLGRGLHLVDRLVDARHDGRLAGARLAPQHQRLVGSLAQIGLDLAQRVGAADEVARAVLGEVADRLLLVDGLEPLALLQDDRRQRLVDVVAELRDVIAGNRRFLRDGLVEADPHGLVGLEALVAELALKRRLKGGELVRRDSVAADQLALARLPGTVHGVDVALVRALLRQWELGESCRDRAREGEDVLPCLGGVLSLGGVQQPGVDLLVRGGTGVSQKPLFRQTERRRPIGQRLLQRALDAAPGRTLGDALGVVVTGAVRPSRSHAAAAGRGPAARHLRRA